MWCARAGKWRSNAERTAELPARGAMVPVEGAHANAERLAGLAVQLTRERRVCGLWLLAARSRCCTLTDCRCVPDHHCGQAIVRRRSSTTRPRRLLPHVWPPVSTTTQPRTLPPSRLA